MLMKQTDDLKALKRELRNYQIYKKKLKEIRREIDRVEYDMTGVKAIQTDGTHGSTNPQQKANHFYDLSNKLEMLRIRETRYQLSIAYIDWVMCHLGHRDAKLGITEVYLKGSTLRDAADKLNYSKSALDRKMNKALKGALNRMEKA